MVLFEYNTRKHFLQVHKIGLKSLDKNNTTWYYIDSEVNVRGGEEHLNNRIKLLELAEATLIRAAFTGGNLAGKDLSKEKIKLDQTEARGKQRDTRNKKGASTVKHLFHETGIRIGTSFPALYYERNYTP